MPVNGVWDNNFFTQLHYENKWFDRLKFQANAKYNYSFSKYRIDISNKYSGGKQEDLNTQNEYYGSAGILYTLFLCLFFVEYGYRAKYFGKQFRKCSDSQTLDFTYCICYTI